MAKVLFQSTNPRLLRSTLVGYLYEIAQEHQVVLLGDGMDDYTKSLLQDKGLFPGLANIIFFESPFGKTADCTLSLQKQSTGISQMLLSSQVIYGLPKCICFDWRKERVQLRSPCSLGLKWQSKSGFFGGRTKTPARECRAFCRFR